MEVQHSLRPGRRQQPPQDAGLDGSARLTAVDLGLGVGDDDRRVDERLGGRDGHPGATGERAAPFGPRCSHSPGTGPPELHRRDRHLHRLGREAGRDQDLLDARTADPNGLGLRHVDDELGRDPLVQVNQVIDVAEDDRWTLGLRRIEPDVELFGLHPLAESQVHRLEVQLGDPGQGGVGAVRRVADLELAPGLGRETEPDPGRVEVELLDGVLAKGLLAQQDQALVGYDDPKHRGIPQSLARAVDGSPAGGRLQHPFARREIGRHLRHQAATAFQPRPLGRFMQLFAHPEPFLPAGLIGSARARPVPSRNLPTEHVQRPATPAGPGERLPLRHSKDAG